MKKTMLVFAAAAMLLVVAPLSAQNTVYGCENSPENPTVVLALVGSAGAFVAAARNRFAARRKSGK